MIRAFLFASLVFFFNTLCFADLNVGAEKLFANDSKAATLADGTLSITVDAAPAPGLSIPKIIVIRGFVAVYENNVNWGDTWNLVVPSATYRIMPLPVTNGTNFYAANSVIVFVPPSTVVNRLITYHIV